MRLAFAAAALALVAGLTGPAGAASPRIVVMAPPAAGALAVEPGEGGAAPRLVDEASGRSWTIAPAADGALAYRAGPPRPPPPALPADALPDGRVVRDRSGDLAAWLAAPTTRYGHGILGDAIEADALVVRRADGTLLRHDLGPDAVFEDLAPRFADIDGDGRAEILVVRSTFAAGAAVAAFRVGRAVELLAATAPIGTPNRWLNPVGVADFDGDGRPELAVVLTPHIGGVLTFYRFEAGGFRRLAAAGGFSNHAIGSRVLAQAAVADFDGDGVADIALPDARRRGIRMVRFAGGRISSHAVTGHTSPVATAIRAGDVDRRSRPDLVYGLEDGTVVVVLY